MKGETPMTVEELLRTIGIVGGAVILVVILGYLFFIRWSKADRTRRGGQIAMAGLDANRGDLGDRDGG